VSVLVYYLYPNEEWTSYALDFLESYVSHKSGLEHDFVVVHKSEFQDTVFESYKQIVHDNYGYDIGTLKKMSEDNQDYDIIVHLGSYSQILTDNWLQKITSVFDEPNAGLVGVSASYEQRPHIRTAVLAFRPQQMLSIKFPASLESKEDQYDFEHGENNVFSQYLQKGLNCGVVDVDGKFWQDNWYGSRTFRVGTQDGLMVHDKMSKLYLDVDEMSKRFLHNLAWGSLFEEDKDYAQN